MKHTPITPQEQKRQNGLHVILGLALLLLSVVLAVNLNKHLSHGMILQAVVNILGILLFCGVGLVLLGGVFRHLLRPRTHSETQEESDHVHRKS